MQISWNYDMFEAMDSHEPVLIAAKGCNRVFMAYWAPQAGRWVGMSPAFEPLCFARVEHPKPPQGKPTPAPVAALPPGIVPAPVVSLPPGVS